MRENDCPFFVRDGVVYVCCAVIPQIDRRCSNLSAICANIGPLIAGKLKLSDD